VAVSDQTFKSGKDMVSASHCTENDESSFTYAIVVRTLS